MGDERRESDIVRKHYASADNFCFCATIFILFTALPFQWVGFQVLSTKKIQGVVWHPEAKKKAFQKKRRAMFDG